MMMDDYKYKSYNSLNKDDETSPSKSDPQIQEPTAKNTTKKKPDSTRHQFKEPPSHLQVRLPRDLCRSLKLMSIQDERSISEIVLECLTSKEMVTFSWINRRDAA